MNLFKPIYSTDDITKQVNNLAQLCRLRDMCMQKSIASRSEEIIIMWQSEEERYTRNIETGQRYLDYITEKVTGKK